MIFSSNSFLFIFLPITLLGYYAFRGRQRNYWLLFVSLIFFGWSQPGYLWIILLSILINYTFARLVDRTTGRGRVAFLVAGVVSNLALLFYFKYFNFFFGSIDTVLGTHFSGREIILPIGISFFTFQGLSYLIDVYRGDVPVQKNLLNIALYIVLFPQLIAGPIVRYSDISREIDSRIVDPELFAGGVQRFIIGLAKKAILANTMASLADGIWDRAGGVTQNTWLIAWVGSIAYTLQIYYDFSGYSDMAIGLGRMFGFHFAENFNLPYISKSISEFWRRWHISLSGWFRDYVYIPLGGNRKRVYLNLTIVFLLTGAWHGAAWHFVLWGLWNLIFILVERVVRTHSGKKDSSHNLVKNTVARIYTLFVVNLGWVLFRAPTLRACLDYIRTMFGISRPAEPDFTVFWYLNRWTILIMIISVFFSSELPEKIKNCIKDRVSVSVYASVKYVTLILIFALSVIRIVSGTYNPFIYFQF
ncbi:alginate O-acetyltransferase complex protein AlgI [Lachnospiraceae bacterium XBB2008]|nr:alginate O-acetyltransferase complex protein AlgI [Lachnospiraceae bacterium XBB2008]